MTTLLWILAVGFAGGLLFAIIFGIARKQKLSMVFVAISLACAVCFVVDITVDPYKNGYTPPIENENVIGAASFDEIYNAYQENELVADDLYKNNRYRITAKISGMETDGLLNMTGGATLTMERRVGNTIVFFFAEFEKEQEDALKTVKVGDTIEFEGTCLSAGAWKDCELVME